MSQTQMKIFLFGTFRIRRLGQMLEPLDHFREQELFCQILLHRDRPFSRETLAGMLWGDVPTSRSRKYLRQTLWKLQSFLSTGEDSSDPGATVLIVAPEWVQWNAKANVWVDLIEFERVYMQNEHVPGQDLDAQAVQALKEAAEFYKGDLLENCYQDWCIFERERFQSMFLAILEKLMDHREAHGAYSEALSYGSRILRLDRARERTHRQMIRLYLLNGDRSEALRQYERCVTALSEELGVSPSVRTRALMEEVRSEQTDSGPGGTPHTDRQRKRSAAPPLSPGEALSRLHRLLITLTAVQQQMYDEIRAVEEYLAGRNG